VNVLCAFQVVAIYGEKSNDATKIKTTNFCAFDPLHVKEQDQVFFSQKRPFLRHFLWRTNFSNLPCFSCAALWKSHVFAKQKRGFPFSTLQWGHT